MVTENVAANAQNPLFDAREERWFAEGPVRKTSPSWRPSRPAPSAPPPSFEDSVLDRWLR